MENVYTKYINYIRQKLLYITNKEADEYLKMLKEVEEAEKAGRKVDSKKLKRQLPKVPYFLEKLAAQLISQEVANQGKIEVEKAKKTHKLNPVEVTVYEVKDGKKRLKGSAEGDDDMGRSGGDTGVSDGDSDNVE